MNNNNSVRSNFLKNRLQLKTTKQNGYRQGSSAVNKIPKPFLKKSFYLDIKSRKCILTLTEDISKLGGILETFLSKEITYVITDKIDNRQSDNIGRLYSVHGSLTSTQSPSLPEMCSPLTPHTSNDEKPRKCLSRGEALLEKAIRMKANNVGTSDILHNAQLLGVEVISLSKFLNWLFKFKSKYPTYDNKKEQKHYKSSSDSSIIHLHEPFIKYELVDRIFKPVFKQLEKWPELNLDHYSPSSPFSCDVTMPVLSPKEKDETLSSMSEAELYHSSKSSSSKSKRFSPFEKFRRKHGYCEICSLHYNDLYKHIEMDVHKEFVNNKRNYLALDKTMSSSQGLSGFLQQMKQLPDERNTDENSEENTSTIMN